MSGQSVAWASTGGGMGALISAYDWSNSPLGPISTWSHTLLSTVTLILPAQAQIVLYWGPEYTALYNDAYAPTIGEKHPRALGRPARENWAELWDDLGPLLRHVRETGQTYFAKDRPFYIERSGPGETAYFDLSYSAVREADGGIGGVLCIVNETTERVRAQKQGEAERERLAQLFRQAPSFMALLEGPDHIVGFINNACQQLIGNRDIVGKSARNAVPEIDNQGLFEVLDAIYRSGEPFVANGFNVALQRTPGAPHEKRVLDFIFQPVRNAAGQITGIFVEGSDVTKQSIALEAQLTARGNQTVLLELGDLLRELDDPLDIISRASELAGRHLNASRAGYIEIDATGEYLIAPADWTNGTMPSFAGRHRLDEFGSSVVASFHDGRPVAVENIDTDPRTTHRRVSYAAIGVSSALGLPILRDGRFRAAFFVHSSEPRVWTAAEESLLRDIGDRVWDALARARAVEALRQSEEQFRRLAQALPHHVWTSLPDGHLNWFNDQVYAFSGLQHGDLDGENWATIVHPEDVADAAARWREAVIGGDPYETEFRLRRRDRTYRWHLSRAVPLRDQTGVITRWIGTNTDVHDQKLTADENRSYRAIIEQSTDFIALTDLTGKPLIINASARALTGLDATLDWSAVKASEFMFTDDAAVLTNVIAPMLQAGGQWQGESSIRHLKTGAVVPVWCNVFPVKDTNDKVVAFATVSRDITLQKNTEAILEQRLAERTRELSKAEETLRHAQKMEAIGQLTGGIAHDFNNLLTGIIGGLSLIERRMAAGKAEQVREIMQAVVSSANRAAGLTHRLLAFSRRQSLDIKTVDILGLIQSMAELLERTVGEQTKVIVDTPDDLWPVAGDANQIESALLNFVINARDAMPDGGTLRVTAANCAIGDDHTIGSRELTPGDYVALSVRDTGTGMDPDILSRAVDPFFTTKPIGQGTGLGLSMAFGYAKQSKGHLDIQSASGRGTNVTLYMPRSATQEIAAGLDAHAEAPRGKGEVILVVEDDPSVRLTVTGLLHELGYKTIEAGDGLAALPILQSDSRIDLLISDVGLPGMNGREVAEIGRKHRPDLKVLFITGYASKAANRGEFLGPGMVMITKPFTLEELGNRVKSMVAS